MRPASDRDNERRPDEVRRDDQSHNLDPVAPLYIPKKSEKLLSGTRQERPDGGREVRFFFFFFFFCSIGRDDHAHQAAEPAGRARAFVRRDDLDRDFDDEL